MSYSCVLDISRKIRKQKKVKGLKKTQIKQKNKKEYKFTIQKYNFSVNLEKILQVDIAIFEKKIV